MLSHSHGESVERDRVLQSIKETSTRAIIFAEATHRDRVENYPIDTQSPYLIYSLFQAAIVQHRLWEQENDPQCKRNIESLKDILHAFTNRWMITCKFTHTASNAECRKIMVLAHAVEGQYLEILENLDERWPPLALPFQGVFISSGQSRIPS